jgi:hypothetical protein
MRKKRFAANLFFRLGGNIMKRLTLLKAVGIWFLFMILAVLNGILRVKALNSLTGREWALPLSGIILCAAIFLVTYIFIPKLKSSRAADYRLIGGLWVLLTLAFEFLFGHYVIGESWASLADAYNIKKGNLWSLVMIVIAVAPLAAAKLRVFLDHKD